MKFKSLMHKALGALATLPMLPALAQAFTMNPAHRSSYGGLTPHEHWEEVWHETMLDITVIGVVFGLACLIIMFGYRRKSADAVGESPKLSPQAAIGWAVIPMVLFLADDLFLFVKGFDLHNHYRGVPENANEVKVTGQMWSWEYDYGNGVVSYGELRVPVGKPTLLRMTSLDVVHSHYLDKFHVTEDLMPGRVTWQWILPKEADTSVVTCREYCGQLHSGMYGDVIAMEQAEYDAWMAEELQYVEADVPGSETKVAEAASEVSEG